MSKYDGPRDRRRPDVMALLAQARPDSLDPRPGDLAPATEVSGRLAAAAGAPSADAGRGRASRGFAPARPRLAPRRLAFAGGGFAAAGTAATLTISALGGGGAPAAPAMPAMLTAAVLHQVAGASRTAMAHSGRAVISYRQTTDGRTQVTGSDDITFSGKNWNDNTRQSFAAARGVHASTQFAIDRIVNGKAYYFFNVTRTKMRWFRDTNPAEHPSFHIPDPRDVLGVLEPAAGFEVAGHKTVHGVVLTGLRATRLSHLPGLGWLPGAGGDEHVTSLVLWVDSHQVVHQMHVTLGGTEHTYVPPAHPDKATQRKLQSIKLRASEVHKKDPAALQAELNRAYKKLVAEGVLTESTHTVGSVITVDFSRTGQPQTITAPAHATPVFSRG
jgi:hypothetical protein